MYSFRNKIEGGKVKLLAVKVHLKIGMKRRLIVSTDQQRVKTQSDALRRDLKTGDERSTDTRVGWLAQEA